MESDTDLPRIPAEHADDLHGLEWIDDCDLALFMAGNQFMVLPELIAAFQTQHPQISRIFYETLPPGLALKQILTNGAYFKDQQLTIYPDVYTAVSLENMHMLAQAGHIRPGAYHCYLHNRLTLMVPRNNPAGIQTVTDLGHRRIRISQPDPANEDIAHHIIRMYREAGGQALVRQIMETKRNQGTTRFTSVHHRETPNRIADGTVDVGPVWATEAIHASTTGLAFEVVEPGATLDQRNKINYYICQLDKGPNPENAARFCAFMRSRQAQDIYSKYGFVPPGTEPVTQDHLEA